MDKREVETLRIYATMSAFCSPILIASESLNYQVKFFGVAVPCK